jgi:CheY-like chemotaxis protein
MAKILVVEDNPANMKLTSLLLQRRPQRAERRRCGNGVEAGTR